MNKHDKTNDHLDRLLDNAFGDDVVPAAGPSVWLGVSERTVSRRGGIWLPRFAMTTAAAACLTVGVIAGAKWVPSGAEGSNWLLPDEVVAGSMWDETSWSLDGLYAAVDLSMDADGGAQ
jgi:hypothetical protein